MSTVLLLLDAFRHDYLSEEITPILWKCSQEGEYYSGVEQSLGFCERTEILTGLSGDQSGFLTAIGYDPQNSPFKEITGLHQFQWIQETTAFLSRILTKNLSSRIHSKLRQLMSRRFQKHGIAMSPYSIPYSWLPFFALTEDRIDHRNPEAFPSPSILMLLEQAGREYFYDSFTALNFRSVYRTDRERLNAVVRDAEADPKDLYLVYVSTPDCYGHSYGPESTEVKEALRQMDEGLGCFIESLESIAPGNRYLFVGDHGMVTVTGRIDAEKEILRLLRPAGLHRNRDVIYFLDSTMVRIWAMSDKAKGLLPEVLSSSKIFHESGFWMNAIAAKDNRVAWPDRRYGDHLWVADPGILVSPDFFHQFNACRGMHGYDPKLPESRGMCIHWGRGITSSDYPTIRLNEVFNLLKKSLEL